MTKARLAKVANAKKNKKVQNGSISKKKKTDDLKRNSAKFLKINESQANGENKKKIMKQKKLQKKDLEKSTTEDEEKDEVLDSSSSDEEQVNKNVKMFKGMQASDESESEAESDAESDGQGDISLSVLAGDSIIDDEDDDDFVDDEDDEDDSIEEEDENETEVSKVAEEDESSNNSENSSISHSEEENSENESEENETDEENTSIGLQALLGDSINEDDDDDESFDGEDDDDESDSEPALDSSKDMSLDDEEDEEEDDVDEEEDDVDEEDDEEEEENDSSDSEEDGNNVEKEMTEEELAALKARTIFVGNVPKAYSKKDIIKVFEKYGSIENIRIRGIVPKDSKMNFRLAAIKKDIHEKINTVLTYVVFKNEASAEKALVMNGKQLEDNFIVVDIVGKPREHDSKKCIFLGNLSFQTVDNDLWNHFSSCGDIESVRLIKDRKSGLSKGVGYVNFKQQNSVALALELNGTTLKGREIRVTVYNPKKNDSGQKKRQRQTQKSSPNKKFKNNSGKSLNSQEVETGLKNNKKKQSQGERKRNSSQNNQSLSSQKKNTFQGQKANAKQNKNDKTNKKKKLLAEKLTSSSKNKK